METVDKLREVVWCDHVKAFGNVALTGERNLYIASAPVYLVVEDLRVKLVCPDCMIKALALRQAASHRSIH